MANVRFHYNPHGLFLQTCQVILPNLASALKATKTYNGVEFDGEVMTVVVHRNDGDVMTVAVQQSESKGDSEAASSIKFKGNEAEAEAKFKTAPWHQKKNWDNFPSIEDLDQEMEEYNKNRTMF